VRDPQSPTAVFPRTSHRPRRSSMRPSTAHRLVFVCSTRFVCTSTNKGVVRRHDVGTKTGSGASSTARVSLAKYKHRTSHIATATHRAMSSSAAESNLVQYVVLRKDLGLSLGWPLGSICAQAAHASVAAVWEFKEHPDTVTYCAPERIDDMHKVVLEVKNETQLRALAEKLTENGVAHKLWLEQPENAATCLATRPYRKEEIAFLFKKCNLAKGVVVSGAAIAGQGQSGG
jgi:peptidyl-tRNA hydrolase